MFDGWEGCVAAGRLRGVGINLVARCGYEQQMEGAVGSGADVYLLRGGWSGGGGVDGEALGVGSDKLSCRTGGTSCCSGLRVVLPLVAGGFGAGTLEIMRWVSVERGVDG